MRGQDNGYKNTARCFILYQKQLSLSWSTVELCTKFHFKSAHFLDALQTKRQTQNTPINSQWIPALLQNKLVLPVVFSHTCQSGFTEGITTYNLWTFVLCFDLHFSNSWALLHSAFETDVICSFLCLSRCLPKCSATRPWSRTSLKSSRSSRRVSECGALRLSPSTSTGTAREGQWRQLLM